MATATAEQLHTNPNVDISPEKYGVSLRLIRAIGHTANVDNVGLEFRYSHEEQGFDDFKTSVTEMLATDGEYGEKANIENVRYHPIVDGKTRSKNGEAMVDVLQNGVKKARENAQENPELQGEVERGECDVEIAGQADELRPGQTRWGVSMAPKKDLKAHPKTYQGLGYQEDLTYFQFYAASENEITAGSFSVVVKDAKILKQVLAEHGMIIPEDASDNEWLKHAQTAIMSAQQAETFIKSLRDKVHARSGIADTRQSMNEYADGQEAKLRQMFSVYYSEISKAVVSEQNSKLLQDFATTILGKKITDIDPDVQRELIRIANSSSFDDDAARALNSVVLYAAAEELRKGLPEFFRRKKSNEYVLLSQAPEVAHFVQDPRVMHHMLASNVQTGVQAGREYGGCPGQIKLSKNSNLGETDENPAPGNKQEAYGGMSGENGESEIPDNVRCIKCRQESPKKEVVKKDCWECPKCKYKVDVCTGKVLEEGKSPETAPRESAADKIVTLFREATKQRQTA